MTKLSLKKQQALATKVTLIGALLDLILGILKIAIGVFSNSFALVSDGIHSLSDLLTDAFVLVISRIAKEKPDREHPYGHGRFETIGTVIVGLILFSVAVLICYDSIDRFRSSENYLIPNSLALLIAALSIISKEWIFRYTRQVANRINSTLLLANAWHSRTDAFSSIAVFIGVLGAIVGYAWMDTLAAVVVALLIANIAWQLIYSSLKELVDTALPKRELEAIRQHILSSPGIIDSHSLRSRLIGGRIFLDIHVQVNSHISVSEGHYLAHILAHSLTKSFSNIEDVVVHIDPELDTDEDEDLSLPLRTEVSQTLLERWQGYLNKDDLKNLNLHYLEEKIKVEITLDIAKVNNELERSLNKLVKDISWLDEVKIYGTL